MADRAAPSPKDLAEDFLFHLYRGGELLQDNRVHEAKIEIENALSLQPSDPKGQDLLGIAYFRLGHYPRAITIFEKLVAEYPEALEPRVNLALCCLKTGQHARARQELEKVVAEHPGHSRAWGYLGLAHQSLGDVDRALHAFTRGGHDSMAKRLMDMTGGAQPPSQRRLSVSPGSFQEIDRSADLTPASSIPQSLSAGWDALLAAAEAKEQAAQHGPSASPVPPPAHKLASPDRIAASSPEQGIRSALTQAEISQRHQLVFPREGRVAVHPQTGALLVQAANGFIVRAALLRSLTFPNGINYKALQRKTRGKLLADEPLGGEASPIVEIEGKGELVLAPPQDFLLVPITLDDEPMYLREDALAAFEAQMSYENGRMPTSGEGEIVGMVQLRGPGTIAALVRAPFYAMALREGRTTALHGPSILGWMGRVIPRALAPTEAPGGMRSLVQFSGEGTVLLHGR